MIWVGAAFSSRARLNHQKASSVARDVIVGIRRGRRHVVSGKEQSGSTRREDRLCGNVHGHHLVSTPVEQLSTVWIPDRLRPSIGRNLPLSARTRVGLNIDLLTAGLVGDIGHPAPIRGEPRGCFREPVFEQTVASCDRLSLNARMSEPARRRVGEEQDLSVRRPRTWRMVPWPCRQALFGSTAVRHPPEDISGAGACRPIRQPLSIRCPDGKLVAPLGYESRGVTSREVVDPDIHSCARES